MNDRLDLNTLRQQIEEDRERAKVNWKAQLFWGFILIIVIPFAAAAVNIWRMFNGNVDVSQISFSDNFMGDSMSSLVYYGALIFFFVWPNIKELRSWRVIAGRVNQFAPPSVPRINNYDRLMVFLSWLPNILFVAVYIFLPQYLTEALILSFVPLGVQIAYGLLLQWANKQGLGTVNTLLKIMPGMLYLLNIKANMLYKAGNLKEAVQIWRGMLARQSRRDLPQIALNLNNLGYVMALAGKYDQALPLLEASIRIAPAFGSAYDSLAIWYLEQGQNPERALELTEMAVEFTDEKMVDSRAVQHATSAHALALTQRYVRTDVMIEQATAVLPKLQPTIAAEVHRQLGLAQLAQGEEAIARDHFEWAIELDRGGLYGKLAARALESVKVDAAA